MIGPPHRQQVMVYLHWANFRRSLLEDPLGLKLDCLIQCPQELKARKKLFPWNDKVSILTIKLTFLDAWEVREELVDKELVKALGISSFNSFQIERFLNWNKPMAMQADCPVPQPGQYSLVPSFQEHQHHIPQLPGLSRQAWGQARGPPSTQGLKIKRPLQNTGKPQPRFWFVSISRGMC